jgi:hypothetical protein
MKTNLILNRGLLRRKDTETLLDGDAVARELVVRGKASWMSRIGCLSGRCFLLQIDSG